jgi:hypothetical protein
MNKSRKAVAGIAVAVLIIASFLGADTLGHAMSGNAYNYELAINILTISGVTALVLFAWNVVTYKGGK